MPLAMRNCANPACARPFQPNAHRVEFCCRQCYLDATPPSPGAFSSKTGKTAAARRWNRNRIYRMGGGVGPGMAIPPERASLQQKPPPDRAALIAKVAAEMGVPVSERADQPQGKLSQAEWAARQRAALKKQRLEDPAQWGVKAT
jgi:hypothetical protein